MMEEKSILRSTSLGLHPNMIPMVVLVMDIAVFENGRTLNLIGTLPPVTRS